MQAGSLARRYARALMQIAVSKDLVEKLGGDLRGFAHAMRTAPELARVVAANPFPKEAKSDPAHLLVVFLTGEPGDEARGALIRAMAGPEKAKLAGRELYVHYANGVGTSKLTNAVIERKLGMQGTARNWNSVTRLLEMAERLG